MDTKHNIIIIKKDFDRKTFNFDNVIGPNTPQQDVYSKTAMKVVEVMKASL